MRKYRQLTFRDRIYIEVWHWERRTNAFMARQLGVHESTIYRELERGKTGELIHGYRADLAEQNKRTLGRNRGRHKEIDEELSGVICDQLRQAWSPEQMSGRLRYEGKPSVCYETIYRFIEEDKQEGETLFHCLRHSGRKRKKRFYIPRTRGD